MRPFVVVLLALACRPDTAGPPATVRAATSPEPGAPSPPSAAPDPAPPLPADDAIDRDLDVMLGDRFTPDHLGPAYDTILARALGAAEVYAQRLTARHAGRARSEPLYADLHVAAVLVRLHPRASDRVALSARQFLGAFGTLLTQAGLDDRQRARLREQVALLKALAGGIDRPSSATADAVRPDRVCAVAIADRHGLTAELDCTCGEQLACRVVRRGDALELAVERLPSPPLCDDCYPSWTTCTLDRLAPGERLRVVVDGRALGSLTTDGGGRLPAGTCLQRPP